MEVTWTEPIKTGARVEMSLPQTEEQQQRQELIRAVNSLNRTEMMGDANQLAFSVDPQTRRPLIRLIDRESGEVLRQIPPDELLRMAEVLAKSAGHPPDTL